MTTWSQNAASLAGQWAVVVRIEGLGPWLSDAEHTAAGGDARFRWCVTPPTYAAAMASGLWKRTIATLPDIGGEELDPNEGGAVSLGTTETGLLDTDDLTALLATDEPAVTSLGAAVAGGVAPGTSQALAVGSSAGLAGQVIYVAGETMRVEAVHHATSIQVTRGYAGSRVLAHEDGAAVHLAPPFFEGRRLEVHLAPLDGDSAAEERPIGEYRIDGVDWDQSLREWLVQGTGQLRTLARLVARVPRELTVTRLYTEAAAKGAGEWFRVEAAEPLASVRLWPADPEIAYFRNGSEILTTTFDGVLGTSLLTGRRGVAFTEVQDLKVGGALRQVFVAEPEAPGSFRWSPGPTPSTSRASGNWPVTAHWLRLLAIVLTSSADPDDGLELTNHEAGGDNYSSLPPGFGVGQPASGVDWASMRDVIMRTEGADLPAFAFGDEPVSFADLVVENFLRPMGSYLIYVGGNVRIVLPRAPLGRASVQIGPQDILTREVGPGVLEPRLDVSRSRATVPSEIVYMLGPQGRRVTANAPHVRNGIGQRGEYGDPRPTTIGVPGADPRDTARWEARGQSILARTSRPSVELDVDLRVGPGLDALPGEVVGVSLEGLPNASKRTRGWTEVNAQVIQQTPVLEASAEQGASAYVKVRAVGYGSAGKLGAVAPAARISGAPVGSVITVEANRYTEADAAGGLPTTDASAFALGDVVRLINVDGTDAAPGLTETVDGIAGHDITLSGTFGGALADGLVVECAAFDSATAAQRSTFAFYADRATRTLGASAETPYRYAEP